MMFLRIEVRDGAILIMRDRLKLLSENSLRKIQLAGFGPKNIYDLNGPDKKTTWRHLALDYSAWIERE